MREARVCYNHLAGTMGTRMFDSMVGHGLLEQSGEALRLTDAGARAATDVTGFGLLGHLFKMCRASGVGAEIDAAAVPLVDGAREALRDGFVSGGTRRNLDWVAPHLDADGASEDDLLYLADAQTSGGLLVVGEVPGAPVVGETVAAGSLGDGVLVQVS